MVPGLWLGTGEQVTGTDGGSTWITALSIANNAVELKYHKLDLYI